MIEEHELNPPGGRFLLYHIYSQKTIQICLVIQV